MSVMQETQKIAAVVLFKDLHSKKMDVYDVLSAFIGDIIVEKGLTKFSTVDMSRYLVDEFGFDSIKLRSSVFGYTLGTVAFDRNEYIESVSNDTHKKYEKNRKKRFEISV